jgi:hypothetical protein
LGVGVALGFGVDVAAAEGWPVAVLVGVRVAVGPPPAGVDVPIGGGFDVGVAVGVAVGCDVGVGVVVAVGVAVGGSPATSIAAVSSQSNPGLPDWISTTKAANAASAGAATVNATLSQSPPGFAGTHAGSSGTKPSSMNSTFRRMVSGASALA